MSKDEFNDEEFKDFMNEENTNYQEVSIIIKTIDHKMSSIRELYHNSLKTYQILDKDDPIKDILKQYIIDLINESKQTFRQFDYAVIDMEEDEGEEI